MLLRNCLGPFAALCRSVLVAVFLLAALSPTHAQQERRLLWSAKSLLAVTSPVIQLKDKGAVVDSISRADVARALEIADRLASAIGIPVPELLITKDKDPNAFVTFGNQKQPVMAINTEMFRFTAGDENKLAAVIGHELGHLKANHLTDGRAAKIAINVIGALLGAAVDVHHAGRGVNTGGLGTSIGQLGGALVSAKYNRDQEREADQLGLAAMAQSGYDPDAVPRLWQAMARRGARGQGLWLDSHPAAPEREQTAAASAKSLRAIYEANARALHEDRLRVALASNDADSYPAPRYAGIKPSATESEAGTPYAKAIVALDQMNFDEARSLFKQASSTGDERATYMIGVMVARGDGGAPDPGAAYSLFTLAAESGLTEAINALARATWTGSGITSNRTESLRLLRIAARRGYAPALGNLAFMYAEGAGEPHIPRDRTVAKALAERSSDIPLSKAVLGTLLRDGVDPARGIALLQEAAPKIPYARYQLGMAYEHGLGIGQDRALAIIEYEKAAAEGSSQARTRIQLLTSQ